MPKNQSQIQINKAEWESIGSEVPLGEPRKGGLGEPAEIRNGLWGALGSSEGFPQETPSTIVGAHMSFKMFIQTKAGHLGIPAAPPDRVLQVDRRDSYGLDRAAQDRTNQVVRVGCFEVEVHAKSKTNLSRFRTRDQSGGPWGILGGPFGILGVPLGLPFGL